MHNLSSLLEDSAASYADRKAVVLGDARLTYAQVDGGAKAEATVVPLNVLLLLERELS